MRIAWLVSALMMLTVVGRSQSPQDTTATDQPLIMPKELEPVS